MIITDNTDGGFDQSLLLVNRVFPDGASVYHCSFQTRKTCSKMLLDRARVAGVKSTILAAIEMTLYEDAFRSC
jgi:hypothetical protein